MSAVKAEVMSDHPLKQQAEWMAMTTTLVQLSGGGSSTMIFLPRGSTTVLLAPQHTKDDYVLWAHTAWINIRWVEIHELNEPLNVPLITKEVQVGLEHYSHFNECVDSA